jgi:two-component system chemotaxis sensor kinase CheA
LSEGKVVRIRDVILPVINIERTIGKTNWTQAENLRYLGGFQKNSLRSRRDETMLVIIESIFGQMALPVQDVIGQAQVVVKAMPSIQNIPEISGAAIMGDGRTILILDPTALVQQRKYEVGSAA